MKAKANGIDFQVDTSFNTTNCVLEATSSNVKKLAKLIINKILLCRNTAAILNNSNYQYPIHILHAGTLLFVFLSAHTLRCYLKFRSKSGSILENIWD